MKYIKQHPEIKSLLQGADHVDVKVVEGRATLREFVASMLSFYPWWVKLLLRLRGIFVRCLGMKQKENLKQLHSLKAEDVTMTPGENAVLFTLRLAKDKQYWIAETPEDKHLSAYFGVVVESIENNLRRFHVVTIVHYKHWTGPLYFNTIRPFHHLVVSRMARAAACRR